MGKHIGVANQEILSLFCFSKVLLDYALFFHAFAPLLFLAVRIPKAIKEHVFDFAAGVIFSDHVQILFGLESVNLLEVVLGQHFNCRLKSSRVFL